MKRRTAKILAHPETRGPFSCPGLNSWLFREREVNFVGYLILTTLGLFLFVPENLMVRRKNMPDRPFWPLSYTVRQKNHFPKEQF